MRGGQVAALDRSADRCAAHRLAVDGDARCAAGGEAELRAEFGEQGEVARAAFAEGPVFADADLAQRARGGELADKVGGRGGCELFIKRDDEGVLDAKRFEDAQLVPRGSEQRRGVAGAQNGGGMWVKREDDRAAIACCGELERAGNDGTMAEMHAIENSGGDGDGAGE